MGALNRLDETGSYLVKRAVWKEYVTELGKAVNYFKHKQDPTSAAAILTQLDIIKKQFMKWIHDKLPLAEYKGER